MGLSPMMQQYMNIKEQHQDCILFFRLGDFYEMFFNDAIIASKELELTLTGKNCGLEERAPMCGVPFHSAENYIARLVEKGYRIAICEQVEEAGASKGIVKREVIQIVTPGTVTNSNILKEAENSFLASVFVSKNGIGLSYCDITTGELNVCELKSEDAEADLQNELVRISPKEIIFNEESKDVINVDIIRTLSNAFISYNEKNKYNLQTVKDSIYKQFKNNTGKINIDENELAIIALGSLLQFLFETQKNSLSQIMHINFYHIGNYMALDKSTIKNLELTETLFEKKVQGSLLGVLDKTHTAMGGRKIKKWIKEPLNNIAKIQERLDAVEFLVDEIIIRNNLKESLKAIYDFERLASKVANGNANGKDLIALKNSLFVLPEIKYDISDSNIKLLQNIGDEINLLPEILELIETSIVEDAPFTIKEGGVIKAGYSLELDNLNEAIKESRNWISNLESIERERTGIKNLKVGYNKVFGYYLEITKSNYDNIPDNYIRKQTLTNAERFITPELKETESLVLNAENKINKFEYDLFLEIRDKIKDKILEIQNTSKAISSIDVITSFAEVSDKLNYTKPIIDDSDTINITNGKHPVIEQTIANGGFVPNDTYLNRDDYSMLLITGPNMAGKSTYMRQTALIVLMAQAGCFVPCDFANIGIADRIFTRIGASDNLASGQSTFYVEMSELAYILNNSTSKSLVILDEIGRGTSTYDGLSIAWAAVEYLCKANNKIRTLFATHYHELTKLEKELNGFKNLNVDVSEDDGNVVFLHKIVEGSASRSYGIHVAKLAGVPNELLENAQRKLDKLEKNSECNDDTQLEFKFF